MLFLPRAPLGEGANAGRHPALLVVPEWWGVTDWLRQDAAHFASEGYVTVIVDLYRGRSTADPAEAHELSRGLPEDRALGDMEAGFAWLAARSDVEPSRIGIAGWCMGGGYALALAVAEPRLKAVAVSYGKLVTAPDKIAAIHAAVLGNFAGRDRGIPPDDVRTFAGALTAAHKSADIKIYDDAGHAFMNPGNRDGFRAGDTKDAWERIDNFFARAL